MRGSFRLAALYRYCRKSSSKASGKDPWLLVVDAVSGLGCLRCCQVVRHDQDSLLVVIATQVWSGKRSFFVISAVHLDQSFEEQS